MGAFTLSRYNSRMSSLTPSKPVEYLVIGHVAHDLTPDGWRLGGTAAYSALTAQALGLRVGIVTAHGPETSLHELDVISTVTLPSARSTTFENIYTPQGRLQYLRAQAAPLTFESVPAAWRSAPIVHLGPIANEVDASLVDALTPTLLGLTPQGWMRQWDADGRVSRSSWEQAAGPLKQAGVVVLSREDVNNDDELIEQMAHQTRLLVVTEAHEGCVLHWHGDRRRFRAPEVQEVDATGAGDVFAAAFFVRLHKTRDPWEAARFATLVASRSVTRVGLAGIPTAKEIEECLMEVLQ